MKRVFDIVVGLAAGLLLLPLILVIAVLVHLIMGPPVIFRQQRPGRYGRPFTLIKFRTMKRSGESDAGINGDAQRLTAFGRVLRSTSLDELPELWNVLAGDMSIVGPRPLLMEYLPLYTPEQARRHEMKPGVTGWAQVNGRNAISWEEKFELDVWYIDHWSFCLDLKILWLTVKNVLLARDINNPGSATMEKFRGTGTR